MPVSDQSRLRELDALRGLAAISVLLFHYSVRFQQLYGFSQPPSFSFIAGAHGVEFFFGISGFVILMTLERCRRGMDFVVSRLSRLYPTYWVALAITVGIVGWLGLPGREVSAKDALINLSMLQEFLGRPDVDGVYWSLEVELMFYAWMLLLYLSGRLQAIRVVVLGWLALALAVGALDWVMHRDPPYLASRYLLLPYIAMFAVGVVSHKAMDRQRYDAFDIFIISMAVVCAWLWAGVGSAEACVLTAAALALLAMGKLSWINQRVVLFLGTISYPLYLVHQNVGYALMLKLKAWGWRAEPSMAAALIVSIVLAAAITWCVEKPAMRLIRTAYKSLRSQTTSENKPASSQTEVKSI